MTRYFIILFLFACTISFGQEVKLDSKLQKKYDNAIQHIRKNNFDKAIKDLNEVNEKSPDYIPAYHKLVGIYYNQEKVDLAIDLLEKAIAINPNYDTESYFSLAVMYQEVKNYKQAALSFDNYIQREKQDLKRIEKAKRYSKECYFRANAIENPLEISPKYLDGKVNSDYSEYMPSFSLDGGTILFTRRNNGQEDLMIGFRDTLGNYAPVYSFDVVNTPYNEGMQTISSDGKVIIYSSDNRKFTTGSFDLFFTFLGKDGWIDGKNLGRRINSESWDAQPSLSADGKRLFFSSERPGGYGKRDIYVSTLNDNMSWSEPKNLGDVINTNGNDEAPFIHPDGVTLYFTSDGHIGMGDKDIFMAKYDPVSDKWSIPVNLGYPINTEKSEGALSISVDGKTAFFASDQLNENKRNLDILYFELPEALKPEPLTYVKAVVYDETGKSIENVKISLNNLSTKAKGFESLSDSDGSTLFSIGLGSEYNLTFSKEGYSFHSENIKLDSVLNYSSPFIYEVTLQSILLEKKELQRVVLNNVFFKSGSAEIDKKSEVEISNLYDLLVSNPAIKINIFGHTDNVGSPDDNLVLSQKRAEAIKLSLIEKGIESQRIQAIGEGENKPLATNQTNEGQAKNRRTEFQIL